MKNRRAVYYSLGILAFAQVVPARALTLDAALARTLDRNPTIQAERFALEQASGRRLVLRSIMWPDARLNLVAGEQGGQRAGQAPNRAFGFVRGFFTQPLFNAAIPASRRRGDLEILLAQQRFVAVTVAQLHAARLAFYTALYERSFVRFAEAQRQRLVANVTTESDRYQAGQGNSGAVSAARLLERELNPRILEAQRGYDGAQLTLAQLMGNELGAHADLPDPEGEFPVRASEFDFETAASAALEHRADVQLARLLVRAADEDQRIVEAGYYPSVAGTLSGDYIPVSRIRRAAEGSPRRSDDIISSEARFGVAYTWRVIDNGKVGGRVAQARAARELNEIQLRKIEADAEREIAVARTKVQAANQRRRSGGDAGAAANRNVDLVQQNLAQGLSSQLEFRTAQTGFLKAETAALTVAYESAIAEAEFDRACGRYFQFSDDIARKPH